MKWVNLFFCVASAGIALTETNPGFAVIAFMACMLNGLAFGVRMLIE